MRVKEFLAAPEEYRSTFALEKKQKTISPVGLIAQSLAGHARGEVVSFVDDYAHKFGDAHGSIVFDNNFYLAAVQDVGPEITAIHFGTALIALEQVIITGEYNFRDHIDTTNSFLVGLPMWKVSFTGEYPKPESIGYRQMREMREMVRKDPTLATFFDKTKENLLPKQMREYLKVAGVLQNFSHLLTEYITFADNFVFHFDETKGGERFTPIQREVLGKADQDISKISRVVAEHLGNWIKDRGLDNRPLG